jgi:hypothetical protein
LFEEAAATTPEAQFSQHRYSRDKNTQFAFLDTLRLESVMSEAIRLANPEGAENVR